MDNLLNGSVFVTLASVETTRCVVLIRIFEQSCF
jgi:hypothetical protein